MAEQVLSTPPSTPPSLRSTSFDIAKQYNDLLASDPTITPPIAAIESLILLLSSSPLHTVSETLSLLNTASNTLLASLPNPLPVSAGADLFQRYLITSFNQSPLSSQSGSDFTALRSQLITNSKVFVGRAKQAKSQIASHALPLLFGPPDDTEYKCTVITYGGSRVVEEILRLAAEKNRWFNVIYIVSSRSANKPSSKGTGTGDEASTLRTLQNARIPTACINFASLPLTLSTLSTHAETKTSASTFVLTGASAVLENGAVVAETGSSLLASVAQTFGLPVYIATESFKFVRQFPVGLGEAELKRMGVRQNELTFNVDPGSEVWKSHDDRVDITSPQLIAGLVTETGMMTSNAVAEELIKLWF